MVDCIIINIIVYIIFSGIVFFKAEIRKNEVDCRVLTKDDSCALRGIAAVFVMLSHYLTFVEENIQGGLGPAKIFCWFGGMGVCLFFFLSGYGLYLSTNKSEITIDFLKKRFATVLPSYFILRLIFGCFLGEYKKGFLIYLLYVLGIFSPLWFICEIILIYIMLYIVTRINKKYRITLMFILLSIMSLIFWKLDFDPRWYNANLIFVVGMVFAKYRSKIVKFLQCRFWLKGFGIVLLFVLFSGIYIILNEYAISAIFKLLTGGLLCFIFIMFLMKIKLNSRPIIYLGKKSLCIYIIHINVFSVINLLINDSGIFLFVVSIVLSILLTVLYGVVEDWISSLKHHIQSCK